MITSGNWVGILELVKEGGRILGGKFDSGVWIVNQLMYRGVPCLLGGGFGKDYNEHNENKNKKFTGMVSKFKLMLE